MGLIEVEFGKEKFEYLGWLLASAGPVPVPTLSVAGADRLMTRLQWSQPDVGAVAPGRAAVAAMAPPDASSRSSRCATLSRSDSSFLQLFAIIGDELKL